MAKKTAAQTADKNRKGSFLKFLGTAGARFVMIRQLRHSGGIWIRSGTTSVLIDPGPGSLVRCASSRPALDPASLDGIILTHKHLDHSGDINVMIEAMTEGGFKKRGAVLCPKDALDDDPVIFRYLRDFPERIEALSPLKTFTVGDFSFVTSMRHTHPVETYGLKFAVGGTTVAYCADTRFFPGLIDFYSSDILIIGVVFVEPRPGIDHLNIIDVKNIVSSLKPSKTILTHFGMTMIKAGPKSIADELTNELGREIVAAYDGMTIPFSS